MRQQGVNSQRAKGNKHFTQVGYANGPDQKAIPRWAADNNKIEKIVRNQNSNLKSDEIFGKMKPKGSNAFVSQILRDYKENFNHSENDIERGSSADWNDDSEFISPRPQA